MAADVETVTVLFTDLVGSTELASRVGPERAEELRVEHFGLLREVIAGANGHEVKNTGDGVMVVFPSAAAAVECAQAVQRHELRNRRAGEQLWVRVGIAMGDDASCSESDFFGPPVVEAARLCAKAGAGQVLLSDLTRMMVGRRGDHTFRSVGELQLKGLPEPVAACELVWEPLAAATTPLPARLQLIPETRYVGREDVRARLAPVREAEAAARQVVLIAGEPGIGKTRLATFLALEAHAQGATVLYGHCDEELGASYQRCSRSRPARSGLGRRCVWRSHRHQTVLAAPSWFASVRTQLAGDLALAEKLAADGLKVGTACGQTDAYIYYGGQRSIARYEQGRLAEVIDGHLAAEGTVAGISTIQATLTFYLAALGRLDDAAPRLTAASHDGLAALPKDAFYLYSLAHYGQVAVRLGDTSTVATIYDLVLPYRALLTHCIGAVYGSAEMLLGHLASAVSRYGDAETHFAAANMVHERVGAPLLMRVTCCSGHRCCCRATPTETARAR